MVRLKCPNCSNVVDAPAGTSPRCPACGFAASATPQAAPSPFSAPEPLPGGPVQRPGWVQMVAIFQFIGGGFAILGGLLVTLVGSVFASFLGRIGDILGGFILIIGLVIVAIGVLQIVLGTQVLKGREWARILSIVLACISGAFDLFGLVSGNVFSVFGLAFAVLIIVGLSLPETRAWFAQQNSAPPPAYATA